MYERGETLIVQREGRRGCKVDLRTIRVKSSFAKSLSPNNFYTPFIALKLSSVLVFCILSYTYCTISYHIEKDSSPAAYKI